MSKDKVIRFRCSEGQAQSIKNKAKQEGKTVSSYILEALNLVATNEVNNVATNVNVATKPKKAKPQQSGNTWKPYDKKAAAK